MMKNSDTKPRLNLRCDPTQMDRIREAAELDLRTVSSFVLVATLERANRLLIERDHHEDAS